MPISCCWRRPPAADHLRLRHQHRADARGQGRHRAERDRPRDRVGHRGAQGGDSVGSRNGDAADPIHARRSGAVQDGRSRPDPRRPARRTAGVRQRDQRSRGADQGYRLGCRRPPRHPDRAEPRGGQHAGQADDVLGRRRRRGHRAWRRVPIILTSRADSLRTRLASCAIAALAARPVV